MPLSREEDFLRNTSILHFSPQNYLPLGVGVMKFKISCLLTLQMLQTKFDLDWPSSSGEEDINAWQMPTHSIRKPESLRWPKKKKECV